MSHINKRYLDRMLNEIKEGLEEIEELVSLGLDDFIRDRGKRFAMRYSIILVVEAATDLGLYLLRKFFDDTAESYREVFIKLSEKGVLSSKVAEGMAALSSLRNMIVHRYWGVDDARIYKEARDNGLETIRKYIEEVMKYVYKEY